MKLNFAPLPSIFSFSSPFPYIVDVTTDPNTGDVYMLDHDNWRRYERPKNDGSFSHFEMYEHMINLSLGLLLSIVLYSVEEAGIEIPTPSPTPDLPDPDPITVLNKEVGDSCCK